MKKGIYNGNRCIVTKEWPEGYVDLLTVGDTEKMIREEYLSVPVSEVQPYLETRMYFFVMYNLSDMQKGIQAGHALVEYVNNYGSDTLEFSKFATFDKTFIVLNGGTSNEGSRSVDGMPYTDGSMEGHAKYLSTLRYKDGRSFEFASFREPDANWAMTAIAFLLNERVYDFKEYPEFEEYLIDTAYPVPNKIVDAETKVVLMLNEYKAFVGKGTPMSAELDALYKKWVSDVMGGELNVQLRNLIRGKRLA